VTTEITYCITRPTLVRSDGRGAPTTDEEPLAMIYAEKGYALTITGALVTWDPFLLPLEQRWETRYTGYGIQQGTIIYIDTLQEGYILTTKEENDTHLIWNTIEGYRVHIRKKMRRDTGLMKVIQNEVVSKLQYNTGRIEDTLEKVKQLCENQDRMHTTINQVLQEDASKYTQSLLNKSHITASATEGYILVWPCRAIESWNISTIEATCVHSECP